MGTRNRVAVGCCWTLCRTPNSATWKESFGTVLDEIDVAVSEVHVVPPYLLGVDRATKD